MGIHVVHRIIEENVAKYREIVAFKANIHKLFIHPRLDPQQQWLPLSFRMEDEEIDKAIILIGRMIGNYLS